MEQIQELRKHFQNTLLDPNHREAFDLLLKEAWQPTSHAMGNAKIPAILDIMNLIANVHLVKEAARLRRKVKELKQELKKRSH